MELVQMIPVIIADAFAKHFYTSCSRISPPLSSISAYCSDFLPSAPISGLDNQKAFKRLRPTKSVGLDDIPGFITKGYSDILVPVLTYIFNLSLSEKRFPLQWKPVYKKGNKVCIQNYRPVSLLNNFSKVFEFIVHDHLFYYLKSKLNPSQLGVLRSKSTINNLVSSLDYTSPLVCSQRQLDAIYFDLSSTFDLVSHTLLLHKLRAYGLSHSYVSWLHSYITNPYSAARIHGIYSTPFEVLSGVPQGPVLDPILFTVFTNDLCNFIKHSRCLLLADGTKFIAP
jgi:hypothetical protein